MTLGDSVVNLDEELNDRGVEEKTSGKRKRLAKSNNESSIPYEPNIDKPPKIKERIKSNDRPQIVDENVSKLEESQVSLNMSIKVPLLFR